MTTQTPSTPPADATGIVRVPDYRSEGYFDKLHWIDLAAPLGLAETASRQEIAAAFKATLERACLCLSTDSTRARALLVGAAVVIAEGEPTGMARALRAASLENQPRLQRLTAASGDTTAPITTADFLAAIGVDVPPGKSGAEEWALVVTQFSKGGHTIGVNDLAGLLHHHTGDLSRDAVLSRLEEVASQARTDLKQLSATNGFAGAKLADHLVDIRALALYRPELSPPTDRRPKLIFYDPNHSRTTRRNSYRGYRSASQSTGDAPRSRPATEGGSGCSRECAAGGEVGGRVDRPGPCYCGQWRCDYQTVNFARAMSRAGCSGSAEGRSAPLPTLTYEMQILDLTNLKPTPGARAAKAARPARGGGVPVATVAPASVVSQSAKQGTPIVKSGRLTRTGRPSPKPKRSRRYTARQLVDLAVAKKFLCRATDAACEFQRRRVLVSVFEAVRVLGLPVIAFARIAGVSPPTLYNWATKARDHGVEAIHPWAGRAYSEEEMELLSL